MDMETKICNHIFRKILTVEKSCWFTTSVLRQIQQLIREIRADSQGAFKEKRKINEKN